MTRLVGDDLVIEIIRLFYTIPKGLLNDVNVTDGLDRMKAEWSCWQTGLSLRYCGHVIFRVKEVLHSMPSKPIDYWLPVKFLLNFESKFWKDIEIQKSSVLEIFIPNHNLQVKKANSDEVITISPNQEYVAKLLSMTVDHIDTLLEDWYPSLGTRFVHTSEGKYLVTRLIPCNKCLFNQATSIDDDMIQRQEPVASTSAAVVQSYEWQNPWNDVPNQRVSIERIRGSQSSSVDQNSDVGYESSCSSRKTSKDKIDDVTEDEDEAIDDKSIYCFLVEECILKAAEEKKMKCPIHGEIGLRSLAPDLVFVDLGQHFLLRPENVRRGKMLGRGSLWICIQGHHQDRISVTF